MNRSLASMVACAYFLIASLLSPALVYAQPMSSTFSPSGRATQSPASVLDPNLEELRILIAEVSLLYFHHELTSEELDLVTTQARDAFRERSEVELFRIEVGSLSIALEEADSAAQEQAQDGQEQNECKYKGSPLEDLCCSGVGNLGLDQETMCDLAIILIILNIIY